MRPPQRGRIEKPDEARNVAWQTRSAQPTEYENRLGDALEQVFASGAHELGEVIQGLKELKVLAPDGKPWTEESFKAEMRRLGA